MTTENFSKIHMNKLLALINCPKLGKKCLIFHIFFFYLVIGVNLVFFFFAETVDNL